VGECFDVISNLQSFVARISLKCCTIWCAWFFNTSVFALSRYSIHTGIFFCHHAVIDRWT